MSSHVVHLCKHTAWKDEWVFGKRIEGCVHYTSLLTCLLLELVAPDTTRIDGYRQTCPTVSMPMNCSELTFFFFKGSLWELQLEFTFPLRLGCYKFYYKQSQKQRTKQNYNLLLFSWEAGNELWHNDLNQFLIKLTYFREHTLTKHI